MSNEKVKSPGAIVQGGTRTSAEEQWIQAFVNNAEQRRAEDDAQQAASVAVSEAQDGSMAAWAAISQAVQEDKGVQFSHNFSSNDRPMVLVKYVGFGKETLLQLLIDVLVDEVTGSRLMIFACPECVRRGIPQELCQNRVYDHNRDWHLDTRGAGEMCLVPDLGSDTLLTQYRSAGKIMDTGILRCGSNGCRVGYKIHNNVMYRI